MTHLNVAITPNSFFHGSHQQQPNLTIYPPPQYPINSEYGSLSFPNDFFNSLNADPDYATNEQITINNSNYVQSANRSPIVSSHTTEQNSGK